MRIISGRLLRSIIKRIIPGIGALVLVIFSSLILFEATKATVEVTENGEKLTVKTHSNTVEELLDELGIKTNEHDSLSHDRTKTLENGMKIDYKQAKQIFVTIDGVEREFYTTADTIDEFLQAEDLSYTENDVVSFRNGDKIKENLSLTIDTAYQVTINDAGEKKKAWTTGGSIKELLDENDITLDKDDKIKPALKKEHDDKTLVTITRVEQDTDAVEENIPFKTERREDSSLAKGKENIISKGQEGKIVKTYEITKENGKEVDRELVEEEVKEESKNQIIAIGTKEPQQELVTLAKKENTTDNTSNEKRTKSKASESQPDASKPDGEVRYMNATAYSAVECTGCDGRGITATGIDLKKNRNMKVVSVDPKVIPLGTKVWVEGYGTAIAGDTGGSIKGNRIDVHVPTHAEASSYGMKKVKVKVID